MGFPGGSEVKNLLANAGDLSSIPGSGRPPGGGHGKPTPVFLPGESHRQRSWMGCSPWGCTESDTTEATKQQQQGRNTLTGFTFFHFVLFFGLTAWHGASLVAQTVENLPAMQEAQVWSPGQEDPLEEGTATHSQ